MSEFICVICPRGCTLKVENSSSDIIVSGNKCKLGYKYALSESMNPVRTVTLNLRVLGGVSPVVPAKAENVPLARVMQIAYLLRKLTVNAPIKSGDVLFSSLLGVKIIAVKSVDKEI